MEEFQRKHGVFIVEDEEDIRRLYQKILPRKGLDVIAEAFDGEAAVLMYENMPCVPELMIIDYQMPFLNGIEAMKRILEFNPFQKILMVSSDRTIKKEALRQGAQGFQEKPFCFSCLVEEINKIIHAPQLEEELQMEA